MMWLITLSVTVLLIFGGVKTFFALGCLSLFLSLGQRVLWNIYSSVPPMPPTDRQKKEETSSRHPLFRNCPGLSDKIGWRELGVYPTPLHTVKAKASNGETILFHVKREDLAHPYYGGNKVRTLQHQLAACEALYEESQGTRLFHLIGSTGSNQLVATKLHAALSCHLPKSAFSSCYLMPDEPDLDNTLNLLSSLSFGGECLLQTHIFYF